MPGTQEYKDVTVNGKNFRIGRINAMMGTIILRKMVGTSAGAIAGAGTASAGAGALIGGLSTEDEMFVQKELLKVVSFEKAVGENTVYVPLLAENGLVADPDVRDDVGAIDALQTESMEYNILPFFVASAARLLKSVAQLAPQMDTAS